MHRRQAFGFREGVIEQRTGLHDLVEQSEPERGGRLVGLRAADDGLEMLRRCREPHDLEGDGRERHADLELRNPDPGGAFHHQPLVGGCHQQTAAGDCMSIRGGNHRSGMDKDALERAVARNTLIRMDVETEPFDDEPSLNGRKQQGDSDSPPADAETRVEDWYFLNTAKGRQSVAAIRQGKLADLQGIVPEEARLHVERPNIFVLYEQNFGLMTSMIADQLRDLERSYPPDWITEAMEIALLNNKRHLNYIRAILGRWETEGKDEGYG